MLRRDGEKINHKRVYRLYRQEKLSMLRRERKRMTSMARTPLPAATRPTERWARSHKTVNDGSLLSTSPEPSCSGTAKTPDRTNE
jgi:hypothetical protein